VEDKGQILRRKGSAPISYPGIWSDKIMLAQTPNIRRGMLAYVGHLSDIVTDADMKPLLLLALARDVQSPESNTVRWDWG
jgi:hypothetical protein